MKPESFCRCENGVLPNWGNNFDIQPPPGFVIVERCDDCAAYDMDIEAAKAWGTHAHYQADFQDDGTIVYQVIARPKK